jgi:hypothetical protein
MEQSSIDTTGTSRSISSEDRRLHPTTKVEGPRFGTSSSTAANTAARLTDHMTDALEQNGRVMWACRPTPTEVAAILRNPEPTGCVVPVPVLVAALRYETGCSRATAYRAVSDALASGEIKRANAS